MINTTSGLFFVSAKERVQKMVNARVRMIMFFLFMGSKVRVSKIPMMKIYQISISYQE